MIGLVSPELVPGNVHRLRGQCETFPADGDGALENLLERQAAGVPADETETAALSAGAEEVPTCRTHGSALA